MVSGLGFEPRTSAFYAGALPLSYPETCHGPAANLYLSITSKTSRRVNVVTTSYGDTPMSNDFSKEIFILNLTYLIN